MITVVLVLNGLLALLCLYAAWQVWCWRSILANVADALTVAERSTHRVLQGAPQAITTGQLGTTQLRQQYQLLTLQLQQVQQILALLGLGQLVWRQYKRQSVPKSVPTSEGSQLRRNANSRSAVTDRGQDDFGLEQRVEPESTQNPQSPHHGSAKSLWMF